MSIQEITIKQRGDEVHTKIRTIELDQDESRNLQPMVVEKSWTGIHCIGSITPARRIVPRKKSVPILTPPKPAKTIAKKAAPKKPCVPLVINCIKKLQRTKN